MKRRAWILTGCFVFLLAMASTGFAQAQRPTIQARPFREQLRNFILIYYDDAFLFGGRHHGDHRDAAGNTEPALLVHSKATNRWLEITAISTENGRFGKFANLRVSVSWDFTAFAEQPFVGQPLKTPGSIMLPDRIEYDQVSGMYRLRYASDMSVEFPDAETVLYVARADIEKAPAQ